MLQVPFVKISVEDRAQDLFEKFSVKAAVQDPCVRLSVQCLYEISTGILKNKISVQAIKK
jgi:hypothetical protein